MFSILILTTIIMINIMLFGKIPLWEVNIENINIKTLADLANIGDYIGGVAGPFLNFVTVALLILSIMFQQRQIKISKEELEATRAEMVLAREEAKRAADANEESVQEQKIQTERAIQSANALTDAAIAQIASAEAQKRLAQANIISLKIQALEAEKTAYLHIRSKGAEVNVFNSNEEKIKETNRKINTLYAELDAMSYDKI
ncbi:hypothetical protein VZ95_20405 [Elstera litoralis]|uniref:Uncharacterized protein n=2 Tax=Elstera litoralis TaxID=552518 RepID=A0A0F3IK85_9PROT|nr:hypothetical protein VZ95_20405 [Elstera litoralis]